MAINEERFSKLYESLDKEGIDPDTLWEIENIAKRVAVIPFEKGRLTLMDDGALRIELHIPDENKLLALYTYVGENTKDGIYGFDCSFIVYKGDIAKKEMIDSGSWWLDDIIERNREVYPTLYVGRVASRKERIEMVKDAYYKDIYKPGEINEVSSKLKDTCEEIIEKLSFHGIEINEKNDTFYMFFQLDNNVQLDMLFKTGRPNYEYHFSRFGKKIDEGTAPDIETIIHIWYDNHRDKIRYEA